MSRIITISGPTASYKSKIAIEVAKRFSGEIINADSRQFFRYMEIGTASPTAEEKGEVPHHLYNILDPYDKINAGLFVRIADEKITEILRRSRIPVIVGGTGLYLKALIKGMAQIPEIPEDVRIKVREMIEKEGTEKCHRYLAEKDSDYAAKISPFDRQRIERALEVILFTNEKFSMFHQNHGFIRNRYDSVPICIMPPRKLLYERINRRTRDIFNKGIIDETKYLLSNNYRDSPAFNAIGYYETYRFLNSEISLSEAIDTTALRTRQYAKRQITWFRKTEGRVFTEPDNINEILDYIELCLK